MFRSLLIAAVLTVFAAPAGAAPRLKIESPVVRATLGGQTQSGGFVTIVNSGSTADRLVGARCACAAEVEIHDMTHEGGIMRMREVAGFDVPARGRLELKPGGRHLMLKGLHAPLADGATIRVVLRFARSGERVVDFKVATNPSRAFAGDAHGHGHAH
jgi:copper(I)-binding protein